MPVKAVLLGQYTAKLRKVGGKNKSFRKVL